MSNIIEQDQIVKIVPGAFGGKATLVIVREENCLGDGDSYFYSTDDGVENAEMAFWDTNPEEVDDSLSDVDADAMTLESAGWGTEEDYGYYGDGEDY